MEYPKTFQEFIEWFPTEVACQKYLDRLRWPEGFRCSHCQKNQAWETKRGFYCCQSCGCQTSVMAGTIFQNTHLSLRVWFHAIWWIVSQKSGINALGLQRALGLGSYRTAWTLLHKLRHIMIRPDREPLRGNVEVDETFVGGRKLGHMGRSAQGKALVIIAAEAREKKTGRIRMEHITDGSAGTIRCFLRTNVHPTSIFITDGWRGYNWIGQGGYRHKRVQGDSFGEQVVLPHVHRVASLLKRWLLGTHHGKIDRRYLNEYLNEFVFRFNRRTSRSRGLLFYRLLQNTAESNPYEYQELTKPKPH